MFLPLVFVLSNSYSDKMNAKMASNGVSDESKGVLDVEIEVSLDKVSTHEAWPLAVEKAATMLDCREMKPWGNLPGCGELRQKLVLMLKKNDCHDLGMFI